MYSDGLKRKIRKLKQLEITIRFGGQRKPGAALIWDSFFDLGSSPSGKAAYTLEGLSQLDREGYKRVADEFFARVYFAYYQENGITPAGTYDPAVLKQLDLPYTADETDVKKRFRELAKLYHPDTGGDAAKFIELMRIYEKLTGRG